MKQIQKTSKPQMKMQITKSSSRCIDMHTTNPEPEPLLFYLNT